MLPRTQTNSRIPLEELTAQSEDVADRRRRGEMSCAECRRLKIRCDKNVPCKACVRRGCRDICPNGHYVTADGPKNVLAATNHLHGAIADLRNRIRELEGSLNNLHLVRMGSTHPLLRIQNDDDEEAIDDLSNVMASQRLESNVSTLAIAGDSSLRYFGTISGAFVLSTQIDFPDIGRNLPGIDPDLFRVHRQVPFPPSHPTENPERRLRIYLPDPIIRNQFLDTFYSELGVCTLVAFTREYVQGVVIPRALQGEGIRSLAALATLFSLMGIGALFIMPGPGESPYVDHYARLASIAIGIIGPLSTPYIEVIEATYSRGYLELLRQGPWDEPARTSFALTCHRCLILGLHRDPAAWNFFTPEEIERRRLVFWMIYSTDAGESLNVGRPANLPAGLAFIDTEAPNTAKYSALRQFAILMAEVAVATQSKPPTYIEIVEFDEKIRALCRMIPEVPAPALVPPASTLLIPLHRTFFARALADYPHDPFLSDYASSVHAVLRAARETTQWLCALVNINAATCARVHWVWSVSLASSLIYVLILGLAPDSALVKEAEMQLKAAITCFETAARLGSRRAEHSLAMITRRSTGTSSRSIPKVLDPSPTLDPEERFAWDPTSLASPLYNSLDGGHQEPSSPNRSVKRASLSPPASDHSQTTASYPVSLHRPRRPKADDLTSAGLRSKLLQGTAMTRTSLNVPEILIHASTSLEPQYKEPTMSSNRARGAGKSQPHILPSLTSEWNKLMQYDPDIKP